MTNKEIHHEAQLLEAIERLKEDNVYLQHRIKSCYYRDYFHAAMEHEAELYENQDKIKQLEQSIELIRENNENRSK